MSKEKSILTYFLVWIILGVIILFIGVSNVFALSYTDIGYLRDQTDMTIEVTYETESGAPLLVEQNQEIYTQIKVINLFVDNFTFNAGVHYQLEISLPNLTLTNANYYEVYDENNNSCYISNTYSIFNTNYPRWNFQCNSQTNSIYIRISNNSNNAITEYGNFLWKSPYLRYTNAPIDSTDSENTDNIINNNNQNTDKIIEELKKGQLTCGYNYKEEFKYSNLNNIGAISGGVIQDNSNFKYSDPTIIFGGYKYEVSGYKTGSANLYRIAIYDSEMNYLFDFNYKNNTIMDLSNYEDILYIVANVNANEDNNLVIVQKNGICVPTSYLQMKQNQQTNDKLDNIEGALTDDSPIDMSVLGDVAGFLPAGPVDSILNLPLTMLQRLSENLSSKDCNTVYLELPYVNKNIELPCIKSLYDKMGATATFFQTTGIIASAFILFNYLLALYKWIDDTLTLRENTMPGYFDDKWGGGA